jgi:hypothetical protein
MNYEFYQQMFADRFTDGVYQTLRAGSETYPCVVVDFNGTNLLVMDVETHGISVELCSPNVFIAGQWQDLIKSWFTLQQK